jgi:flagellar FliJ protein
MNTAYAKVEAAKPDWQRQKQKLGSYEVLQARGNAAEAQQTARREQRDADEHAARTLRMRAEGA